MVIGREIRGQDNSENCQTVRGSFLLKLTCQRKLNDKPQKGAGYNAGFKNIKIELRNSVEGDTTTQKTSSRRPCVIDEQVCRMDTKSLTVPEAVPPVG